MLHLLIMGSQIKEICRNTPSIKFMLSWIFKMALIMRYSFTEISKMLILEISKMPVNLVINLKYKDSI